MARRRPLVARVVAPASQALSVVRDNAQLYERWRKPFEFGNRFTFRWKGTGSMAAVSRLLGRPTPGVFRAGGHSP
jgi:hypothetical protein